TTNFIWQTLQTNTLKTHSAVFMWMINVSIAISAGKSRPIFSSATMLRLIPMFFVSRRRRTKKRYVRRRWKIARSKRSATTDCEKEQLEQQLCQMLRGRNPFFLLTLTDTCSLAGNLQNNVIS